MHIPRRSRRGPTPLLLALAAVALLGAGAASASAASSIEGIWSFDGGEIGIHALANGTFEGTVVAQTTFAECPHPVEETIWTDIREQPDGSFWGFHEWFYEHDNCIKNPHPGPAAWRVFEEPDGSRYLRVCLSEPGTTQPTIPLDGPETGVTYKCYDSALTEPLPTGGAGAFKAVAAPKQCVSGRRFAIHLAEPRNDPFKTVRVTLRGHRLATVRRGAYVDAIVDLKGLPPGAFTIEIRATTVLGVHLSGSRTYHTCAAKPKKHKPARLKASTPAKSR